MGAEISIKVSPPPQSALRLRKFDFDRDRFAFPNELLWEYRMDAKTNRMTFVQRDPKPAYAHHCFVLARSARQFLYHARFDSASPKTDEGQYRRIIRSVVSRNPRRPCEPGSKIHIPGYANLYEFSHDQGALLKAECGGAWQSYVLRSHWRMIFPISRAHQTRTANQLAAALEKGVSPIVHLVTFPTLTINHGMILFDVAKTKDGFEFAAYDPNDPQKPTPLLFDFDTRTFSLRANHYWAGGKLNVIEIYKSWLM